MSKLENSIGWCDVTGNKVIGCEKVSEGCKNCYAELSTPARVHRASGLETWGSKGGRIPVADFSAKVRRLNKLCVCDSCHETFPIALLNEGKWSCGNCCGTLRRIRFFADSNSDFLDERWGKELRREFFDEIDAAENIDVLLLTKRIENFNPLFSCAPHVWIGVSIENQKRAEERIPQLLKIPVAVRFLSVEPLLSAVDIGLAVRKAGFDKGCNGDRKPHEPSIDWVIVGGESGANRRDCGVEAIVSVADQCVAAGVPVYVKQDCAFKSGQQGRIPDEIWKLKQFPVAVNRNKVL